MNTSIFTIYNPNHENLKDKLKYHKEMKMLAKKNAKKVIITFPNGNEKIFNSAMEASRYLKGSSSLVSRWIKYGGPTSGKWKGYSARLVEDNEIK